MHMGSGGVMRWTASLAAALLLGVTAPTVAAAPAPVAATRAAKARAAVHYGTARAIRVEFSLRSSVDRRWALVTGTRGSRTAGVRLWAVWLRQSSGGRWRALYFIDDRGARARGREFRPLRQHLGTVPCDLVPAYSEPDC